MPVKIKMACPEGPLFDAAKSVVKKLRDAGFQTYWVGGAPRDIRRGDEPEDIDMVTVATPEAVKKIFPESDLVGACFGVSLVKEGGFVFEVATCREERGYTDGRRPDSVRYTKNFEMDIQRRDFTINAMLYEPNSGELIDYVAALVDLDDHNVRAVGNPLERFNEDYLRMLRAVRFAARLDFNLAPSTFNAIGKLAAKVNLLAPERVREELELMLTGEAPASALRLLKSTGLLAVLLPEIDALAGVAQPKKFHPEGDVWEHTLLMFDYLEERPTVELAWSILLHDAGKPVTRTVDDNKVPHFYNHEVAGAEIAASVAERLRFSNDAREHVVHAVRNHMRFATVREMREAKLKRLMAEPEFELELELHRLDCQASHGMMECYDFLTAKRQGESRPLELPPPLITGDDLIAAGYRPGPEFREMLDALMDEQLDGVLTDRDEALEFLKTHYPPDAPDSQS